MLAEVTLMNLAETNRILRLSDSQLAIVRQAAVPLSPSARDRYLKTVAAELAEADRVDDATAARARRRCSRELYLGNGRGGVRRLQEHDPAREAPTPVARRQARRWMATRRPNVVSEPIQVRKSSQFTPARALPDSSGNA